MGKQWFGSFTEPLLSLIPYVIKSKESKPHRCTDRRFLCGVAEGHIIWQEDGNFHTLEISNASHSDASVYSACAVNAHGSILCSCRLIVDTGLR